MALPKKGVPNPIELRRETRDWLKAHTIADVRAVARDLENAGEDVSDLVDAINDLEALVDMDPTRASRRGTAKAEV